MKIRIALLSTVLFAALSAGAVFIAGSFDRGIAAADAPPSVPAVGAANTGQQVEADDTNESENEADDHEEVGDHDNIQDEQGDDGNDAETAGDQAALAKRTTVTEAQAIAAASAKVAGKVVKVELEDEAGEVLYSIEFDSGQDAEVNATTGAVLKVGAANAND